MSFRLSTINERVRSGPAEFAAECDNRYHEKVLNASSLICENLKRSPIILLSGPSGSGKTTTAKKVEAELMTRGIKTYTVSLDNYFRTVNPKTAPRTPDGAIDFESPSCLDFDLLNEHFRKLSIGEEVRIPRFVFSRQERSTSKFDLIRLAKDEMVIFEGIHALNDSITTIHPEAFKLYVSARSNVLGEFGEIIFKGTWMRLIRRVVRDNSFRGTDAQLTLNMWANVRRGEKLYISPFKDKADFMFDSSLRYEVPVMKHFAKPILEEIPKGIERFDELRQIIPAFDLFDDMDSCVVPAESLLREFIGGGIYKY